MVIVDNDSLLTELLHVDVSNMLDNVSQVVVEKVKDIVNETVYLPYPENRYERLEETGGFLGSWVSTDPNSVDQNTLQTEIYSDPSLMQYNPSKFQHGNDAEDRRNILDIAIEEGTDYDFVPVKSDYFTPIVEMLEDGKAMEFIIEANLKKLGVNFIKS